MKITQHQLYGLLLYISSSLILLGPFLSTKLGIPRLDTALMPLFFILTVTLIFFNKFSRDTFIILVLLLIMCLFSFNALILNFTIENILDYSFFYFFISLFLYGVVYFKDNYLIKIRQFLFFLSLITLIGFFLELIFKVQLVVGNKELEVSEGAFKGFFFNTNDQAVISTCFSALIAFFFILDENNRKIKSLGYFLVLLLGVVIFVSASRAAILGYAAILFLVLFLNSKSYIKFLYSTLGVIFSFFLFNPNFLIPVFNFLIKFSWLERSIVRLELAIFALDEDNSVSYRAEIYQKFFENFKILWIGYGPRNYEGYFNLNPLSYSLGYRNPHSFFMEMYLAFGLFSFIALLSLIFLSSWILLKNIFLTLNQKIFFIFSLILFCWLVWIPSSILRLPFIWCLILFIVIYSIHHKRTHLNTSSSKC
ncbi:O-antigen ligase family protein [Acinetobacter towneri]|uniref:O-antigen ligase family protein n=1 Tax=Acinetobacter TaxID=469 RepID=UPI00103DB391|nr:O-antigen ligase family protein [Acinetobacter sp. ANC 5045]TCB18133.1 O-antigen ligase domain-containing protein [Acinetobacter sp. ANC 5045]